MISSKTLSVLCTAFAATLASTSVLAAASGDAPSPKAKTAARAGWVDAPAGKHNGSGIRVSYNAPAMQPGQTATVQLQFSGVTGDDASVVWRAPEGGSVSAAAPGGASSMALPRGQVSTLTLQVTPGADGLAYLDVFTVQQGRGSALSVPLKVGSGAARLKREGTTMKTPSGEVVTALPSTPK